MPEATSTDNLEQKGESSNNRVTVQVVEHTDDEEDVAVNDPEAAAEEDGSPFAKTAFSHCSPAGFFSRRRGGKINTLYVDNIDGRN